MYYPPKQNIKNQDKLFKHPTILGCDIYPVSPQKKAIPSGRLETTSEPRPAIDFALANSWGKCIVETNKWKHWVYLWITYIYTTYNMYIYMSFFVDRLRTSWKKKGDLMEFLCSKKWTNR